MDQDQEKPLFQLKFYHVLILIFLLLLGSFLTLRWKFSSMLQAKLKQFRDEGYPTTPAQLDKWYSIPPDVNNAADTYLQAFSYYNQSTDPNLPFIREVELPPLDEPLSQEIKTLIAQFLADNEQTLQLLHKAAKIKHCRYPIDFSRGIKAELPYLSETRTAAKLLQLQAIFYTENNQTQKTVESINAIFALADSLSDEPVLMSQLVSTAVKALAVNSLERALNRVQFTDPQLKQLDQMLSKAQNSSNFPKAFIGEACMFADFRKFSPAEITSMMFMSSDIKTIAMLYFSRITNLEDLDTVIYLDMVSEYNKACQLPRHKRLKEGKKINSKCDAVPRFHFTFHLCRPAIQKVLQIEARVCGKIDAARTAIAVQRYRLQNSDRLPEKLSDLVPEYMEKVPLDPFDGNDLRYKKLNPGFSVYHIGEDEKDDHGKPKDPNNRGATYDWPIKILK